MLSDLFRQLGEDFNRDLFGDNLDAESGMVLPAYFDLLDEFCHATDVLTGQLSFWPCDFGVIPTEAIRASSTSENSRSEPDGVTGRGEGRSEDFPRPAGGNIPAGRPTRGDAVSSHSVVTSADCASQQAEELLFERVCLRVLNFPEHGSHATGGHPPLHPVVEC